MNHLINFCSFKCFSERTSLFSALFVGLKDFEDINIILPVKPFNSKLHNISNSLNSLNIENINPWISLKTYVNRDRLDFCVNVKEFLFVRDA